MMFIDENGDELIVALIFVQCQHDVVVHIFFKECKHFKISSVCVWKCHSAFSNENQNVITSAVSEFVARERERKKKRKSSESLCHWNERETKK
jgi:hypothetical protein